MTALSSAILAGLLVVVLLRGFRVRSAPSVVVAVTVLDSWESVGHEAHLVCWAGPFDGVTSENVICRNSIGRSTDLCIA